ncbi:hypothetical protein ECML606-1_000092 [Escherichia phage ECML-606-1]|nr:hypothetical protein ECML606-1_000092 [Escherichia phage ECML-606-1]
MANPDRCPHCGGKFGVVVKSVIKYTHIFDWDGTYDSGETGDRVSGGKAVYCSQCMKEVTHLVTVQMPE